MADRDWRALERLVRATPNDGDLVLAAITARRRAGVAVPGWMLDRLVLPARRFAAPLPGTALIEGEDGRRTALGRTGGSPLQVPAHRALGVQPDAPTDAGLPEWAEALAREAGVGLSLGADVSDAGLGALRDLGSLPWLDLAGCPRVSGVGLGRLSGLTGLARLGLWGCRGVDDVAARHLGALRSLTWLDLGGTSVGGGGLAALGELRELWVLSLAGCAAVTDADLAALAGLERLAALDLRRCARVTDAGVAHLAHLRELTLLNLSFCSGLTARALEPLADLPRLSRVLLVGCGAAAARARSALRCEVVV